MYSYGPPYMAKQKQDDQLEHTYSCYVRISDVALKTCQRRWTIGRSGKRGSGISVLAVRHDDDDDDDDIYWCLWYHNKWNKNLLSCVYILFRWICSHIFPRLIHFHLSVLLTFGNPWNQISNSEFSNFLNIFD